VSLAGLKSRESDAEWLETEGVVEAASVERGQLVLTIADEGARLRARILAFEDSAGADRLGARVRVRGVKAVVPGAPADDVVLYVPTAAEVAIVSRAPAGSRPTPVATPSVLPLLTRVEQIRNLKAEEAEKAYPVHIRGTITFYYPPLLFIQDDANGIFVRSPIHTPRLAAGQQVELWGVTGPGQFAPIIDLPRIKILGPTTLPKPERVTVEQLFTGEKDAQWVEVEGLVVRRLEPDRLTLGSGYHEFRAWVPPSASPRLPPAALLNARVKIRGVPNVYFNQKRQVMGIGMSVPSIDEVEITEAAPEPSSLQLSPISSLLRFSPDGGMGHRIRIQGTVMMERGGHTLYVQDETGAAQVQTQEDASGLESGDRVDVLGFPAPSGGYAPVLQDAIVRKTGTGTIPEPVVITAADAMSGEHDLEWAQITGRLLDATENPIEHTLTVQSDKAVFTTHVDAGEALRVRNGSLLRLTGICRVHLDENRQARSFQMMLRSPRDVVVLASPPWLRLEHVLVLFGLLAGAGFFVHRLRLVQVRAGFKAVTEERARLAREIHDTLQQRLVGVLMQLEIVNQSKDEARPRSRERLNEARALVRSSMAEARRLVQNLRSPVLDEGDLPQALREVVEQLGTGAQARIELHILGKPRRLPDMTENNLLRIAQEALVNAVKHGRAKHIQLELCFGPGSVRLGVQDDGCGFDGAAATPRDGHFGVLGMRERAQQLGGQLFLHSEPGAGTEVRVAVPLES
jgi:signal transduction histidine kinase